MIKLSSGLSHYQLWSTLKYEFVYLNQNLIFLTAQIGPLLTLLSEMFGGGFVVSTDWTLLYKSGDAHREAEASLLCLLLCYIWADENAKSEIMS